jgi:cytochrome c-type biogenesis protein CcmH
MTLWILIAVMTAVAALSILVPLSRKRSADAPVAAADEAVYRQQLDEVEKDLERGLIDDEAAAAARTEIARRLLAAHDRGEAGAQDGGSRGLLRLGQATAVIGLPLVALGLYVALGSPDLPDQPLTARLSAPAQDQSVEVLVARVERHLAQNPEDGEGWKVIAPVYMRLGKPQAAAAAFSNAIRLLGPSPILLTELGEAITVANSNVINADARKAFEQAVKMDPNAVKPRFFLAHALGQEGRREEAIAAWQALLKGADPRAPWVPTARDELAKLGGQVPTMAETLRGPSQEQMAAASQMSDQDRNEMIAGMVANLAERLDSGGGRPEEWVRLIRAYSVLGDAGKAQTAYDKAVAAYKEEPEALRQISAIATQLGLKTN